MAENQQYKYLLVADCFKDGYSSDDDFIQYINDKFDKAAPFKKASEIKCVKLNESNFEIQSDYRFSKNIIRQYLAKYLNYAQLNDYVGVSGTTEGFSFYYFAENEE